MAVTVPPEDDVSAAFGAQLDKNAAAAADNPPVQQRQGDVATDFGAQLDKSSASAEAAAKPDYAKMGFGEALRRGWGNAPAEIGQMYTALPAMAAHPGEAWNAIKSVGRGIGDYAGDVYNYATGQEGGPETEQSKQDREAAKEMAAPYTSLYHGVTSGDWAPMKQQLAEHLLTTGVSYIPNPTAAGAKVGQALGNLGRVGKVAGTAAKYAGRGLDLATNPVAGASTLASGIGAAAKGAAGFATGAGGRPLELAAEAGRNGGSNLDAFNRFFRNEASPVELSQRAGQAVSAEEARLNKAWAAERENIFNTNPNPVVHQPIADAWRDALAEAQSAAVNGDNSGLTALQRWHQTINDKFMLPTNDPQRGMRGFDQLKRILQSEASGQGLGYTEGRVLNTLHAGVRDALNQTDSRYGTAMTNYQRLLDESRNLRNVLGSGDNVAATNEANRLMRAQKNGNGQALLDRLAVHDPDLPFMIAGSALNPHVARGGAGTFEKLSSAGHLANIGYQALHGGIGPAALSAGLWGGQALLQNPHVAGTVAKAAGAAAPAVGAVAGPAGTVYNVGNKAANLYQQEHQPRELTVHPRAPNAPYARGGKVGHQHLVDRLFRGIEQAKKAEQGRTSVLLQQPDEHIAKALKTAQAAI